MLLHQTAVDLIESGVHAHIATVNPDGSPQVTMTWSTIENGEICIACLTPRRKLDNVRRDPRVVISYESPQLDTQQGLHYYLAVTGTARVTDGGAPELLRRIAPRYVVPGVKFPRAEHPPEGWIMRVKPLRVFGYGPWAAHS